jgi:preprotein translocase subunit Sec63
MAPPPITEDYYMVLEVEQNATAELIVKSYKRLAFKLHPDRNSRPDATAAFQLVFQFITIDHRIIIYTKINRSSWEEPTRH